MKKWIEDCALQEKRLGMVFACVIFLNSHLFTNQILALLANFFKKGCLE